MVSRHKNPLQQPRERETLTVVRSLIDIADFEGALKNLGNALSEEGSISLESFFFIEPCFWYSNIPFFFSLGYIFKAYFL